MNTKPRIFLCLLSLVLLASCSYRYKLTVTPEDAVIEVDGEPLLSTAIYTTKQKTISIAAAREGYVPYQATVEASGYFAVKEVDINLGLMQFQVSIDAVDAPSQYAVDNTFTGTTPARLTLSYGKHTLIFSRENYEPQTIELDITGDRDFVFRHQPKDPGLKPVGVFPCGSLPKQLIFSPDNNAIYITLLDNLGYQVFDMDTQTAIIAEQTRRGYVEGLFVPRYNSFFVTQMSTDSIWEYTADGTNTLKRKLASYGRWPKVVDYCDELDALAVSNWIGDNVAVIDYKTGKLLHSIPDLVTPRGVVFTNDGQYLVVCSYDGGFIRKYATADWKQVGQVYRRSGCMRHVVMAKDDKTCWVSDMLYSVVYEIDMDSFTTRQTYKCFALTNTIEISPDERFLFASNRGPNHPKSYLLRSPENGQVTIIDLVKKEVLKPIYGGNQPTGLDVSGDGKYLCFSNFRDMNFEIYELGNLYK